MLSLEKVTNENILWEDVQASMGDQTVQGVLSGLGAAGDSMIVYKADGFDLFTAWIGYLKTAGKGRKALFEVLADGVPLYSEEMESGKDPAFIKVPIRGKQLLMLRIHPQAYGATQGAAFGTPMVVSGAKAEDMDPQLQLDIDGKRTMIPMPGGRAPASIPVPIPVSGGTTTFRVKVVHDPATRKVQITTEKAP